MNIYTLYRTMAEYVNDARAIFKEFRDKLKTDKAFAALKPEEHLDMFQRNYPQFAKVFPIPLRYMIEMRQFSTKAFTRIVKKMSANPYRSKEQFCRYQADYVQYLISDKNPSHNREKAVAAGNSTYDSLIKEVVAFDEAESRIKERNNALAAKAAHERREELRQLLTAAKGLAKTANVDAPLRDNAPLGREVIKDAEGPGSFAIEAVDPFRSNAQPGSMAACTIPQHGELTPSPFHMEEKNAGGPIPAYTHAGFIKDPSPAWGTTVEFTIPQYGGFSP